MVCILLLTVAIVLTKVRDNSVLCLGNIFLTLKERNGLIKTLTAPAGQIYVLDPVPDPNISTFRPLDQKTGSNIRYNSDGYIPCNGYVPCQVVCRYSVNIMKIMCR